MNNGLKFAIRHLREEIDAAKERTEKDYLFWKKCLAKIPMCYIDDLTTNDVLRGKKIKGRICIWQRDVPNFYDPYFEEPDDDEYDDYQPDEEDQLVKEFTARFIFKEKNVAKLIYHPASNLPTFVSTWEDVIIEIFDYARRELCDVPKPPRNFPEKLKAFNVKENSN